MLAAAAAVSQGDWAAEKRTALDPQGAHVRAISDGRPPQPETWWRCYVQAKAVGRRLKPRPSPRRPALPAAMARHRTRLADNARHPSFPSRRKDVPKPASLQWQRWCLGLQDRDSWGYAVSNPREVRVFLELGAHRSPACGQTLGRPILPSFLPRAIHRGVKCWIQ
jgi:hypothetical protein